MGQMKRRLWLKQCVAQFVGTIGFSRFSLASETVEKIDLSKFPFEVVETTGSNALADWEKLKGAERGIPIIIGGETEVGITAPWFQPEPSTDPAKSLADAESKQATFSLRLMRKKQDVAATASLKEMGIDTPADESSFQPYFGDWPAVPEALMEPVVTIDLLTGKPLTRVYIALVPAKSDFEIPAYMRWGGWNSNPPPYVHVIMLRRWSEKYGAELVGMTDDVINLRIKKRPATRDEAIELAQEMYLYCADIVDQGTGDISKLAASLMVSDYWYFWWD
jgi:hypothetical protein